MSVVKPAVVDQPLLDLLAFCNLPVADISTSNAKFWAVRQDHELRGCIGLETNDGVGLLRSLAVATESRGQGLGAALVGVVEDAAREGGVSELYLITNTAQLYFESFGFVPVVRAKAPPIIATSRQFTSLCPSTSSVMRKLIG